MELYESMEEGKEHTIDQQRTILDNIKEQALYNYQIGLHEKIKLLVRPQRYRTLQEAIVGVSAEKKVKDTRTRYNSQISWNKSDTQTTRNYVNTNAVCMKCGKNGHYERDCRSSRYVDRFCQAGRTTVRQRS